MGNRTRVHQSKWDDATTAQTRLKYIREYGIKVHQLRQDEGSSQKTGQLKQDYGKQEKFSQWPAASKHFISSGQISSAPYLKARSAF